MNKTWELEEEIDSKNETISQLEDEAHIIYNYLKSKENTCKYIAIPEQWINDMDSLSLDKAIDEFILDNF